MRGQTLLPSLSIFATPSMNHIVMVYGTIYKPLCIRNPLKHGTLLDHTAQVTCEGCKNRGWTKSLGPIGKPVDKDQNGRYLSRTQEEG